MRKSTLSGFFLLLAAIVAAPVWSQSVVTEGNVETDAQLVSKVATGTAPLDVSSTTMVPNLNADLLDGLEGAALALDSDLQNVETLILALIAQVPELGKVPLPRTGQTTCYDVNGTVIACGTGVGLAQDGDLQLGVTWPNPRFTNNGDGTVTDELTSLIWMEEANCFGLQSWVNALAEANALFDGCSDCGGTNNDCNLSDGSLTGEWRLPNLKELLSLITYGFFSPAIPDAAGTGQWSEGDAFSNVQPTANYWTSTTNAESTDDAWGVDLANGLSDFNTKTNSALVWLVRGGQ